MAARSQGVGGEAVGNPDGGNSLGGGGPLTVVRARCVAGQVVRVTFNETPVARSAAGLTDATNPANYRIEVVIGQVNPAPLPMGVDGILLVYPAAGVQQGDERAVDVHVDKQLVVGVTYRVIAVGIKSKFGGSLGYPFSAEFPGMIQRVDSKPLRVDTSLVDIANDISTGAYVVDDSGDLAPVSGVASLRKRIYRRLLTAKGAFTFLPGYGVGLALKEIASVGQLASIKADIEEQIKQEPEVKNVQSSLTLLPLGVMSVNLSISTQRGGLIEIKAQGSTDGVRFV